MSNVCTDDWRRAAGGLLLAAAFLGLLLAIPAARAAPDPAPPPAVAPTIDEAVERLVADALAANLDLAAATAETEARLAALDQARARYLPALDLDARYSRASGGRTIDFPVGDLLNPVYATLNQLTGQARFPAIENVSVRLLRPREQETKLSLTQPLYDARLGAARDAAAARVDSAEAARATLRSRLARDVRQAYYRWLEARARLGILDATLEAARANLHVNDSLFRHGKVTRDLVYRAEADVLEVEQGRLAADHGVRIAQSYVNLLRNAPFDRELPLAAVADPDVDRLRDGLARRAQAPGLALPGLESAAVDRRTEFRELDAAAAAAAAGERLARAAFRPQLAFAVDAGSQGEDYRHFGTTDDRFVLASVVLRFSLFAGGADRAALRGARAAQAEVRAQRAAAEQRIRLEVQEALSTLEVAGASLATAERRVQAAAGAFAIAQKKRDLGQINQAEYVDARRALTDAELNQNVTRFEALDGLAQLEYAVGRADRDGATP
jgi:outer membrane protein TolC